MNHSIGSRITGERPPCRPAPFSRPWRRFLRFSVRGMIVVVLLIGGWAGVDCPQCSDSARGSGGNQDATEATPFTTGSGSTERQRRQLGSPQAPPITTGSGTSERKSLEENPRAPKWLVDLIGADYFGHITYVGITPKENFRTLAQVGLLLGLQELNLNQSSVGDAEIQHLKGLSNLSILLLGTLMSPTPAWPI